MDQDFRQYLLTFIINLNSMTQPDRKTYTVFSLIWKKHRPTTESRANNCIVYARQGGAREVH